MTTFDDKQKQTIARLLAGIKTTPADEPTPGF